MIDFKIGEHGRLYLLKHQKTFGVGDFDYFLYLCFSFGLVNTSVHSVQILVILAVFS